MMNRPIRGDVLVETTDISRFTQKVHDLVRKRIIDSTCSLLSYDLIIGLLDSGRMPKDQTLRSVLGDMLLLTPEEAARTTIAYDPTYFDFSMRFKQVGELHYLGHIAPAPKKGDYVVALNDLPGVTTYYRWQQDVRKGITSAPPYFEKQWISAFDEPDAIVELSEISEGGGLVRSLLHGKEFAEEIIRSQPFFLRFLFKTTDEIKSRLGLETGAHTGEIYGMVRRWVRDHQIICLPTPLDVDDLDKTYDELNSSRFITLDEELIEDIVYEYEEREKNNELQTL